MAYTVYVHVNKKNGKKYVGITKRQPEKRWDNGNGYYSNKPFYNAIRKYGWNDGFSHIIIETGLSADEASAMEKALISLYDSNNIKHGYNLTEGGFGYNGFAHAKEKYKWVKYSEIKKDLHKMILFLRLIQTIIGGQELKEITETIVDNEIVKREEKITVTKPDYEAIKSFVAFYEKEEELQHLTNKLKHIQKQGGFTND